MTRRRVAWIAGKIRFVFFAQILFLWEGIQMPAQTTPPASAPISGTEFGATPFAFEVASINPSGPNSRGIVGFVSTGLQITDFSLYGIVSMAYFPLNSHSNQIVGMPDSLAKEHYDVIAHIDEATASEWVKLSPQQRQQPGRLMLQKLLAERCKLVAHIVPIQVNGYTLVIGKGGSHLTPTKPDETYPPDAKNGPDGSKVVYSSPRGASTISFYNASVEQLAEQLGWAWDIHDQTGLTGRYDFTIRRLELVDAEGKRIPDPQPNDLWDISGTGLEIKSAKVPSEKLVIDQIERPTPN